MSAPGEHKPTGLVSGSQCPREQSPSAETKRGWLRCHLHHKGKSFLPEPLPLRHAAHHIYQRLWTHVTSAFLFFCFFFVHLFLPCSYSLSLAHAVCPPWPISTEGPPPSSSPFSSVETTFLACASTDRYLFFAGSYVLSAVCIIISRYKEPLTHLLSFPLLPLWLSLASCIPAQPTCRRIGQKAQSPAVRP